MAPGVPSLFHISQSVCVRQAARITDVGDTPYHLIKPILKRLNAKQLALLEENSPIVTPHSDELWGLLIEKDFPDRPFNPAKLKLMPVAENAQMPRKALYQQYLSEKEHFLATSADRLRKMTEKLRREKSKNSITTVQGIIADPTIRRRVPQYSRSFNSAKPRPRSILGKAMRDVSQRSLMFGGANKSYDPYKPFQAQKMGPGNPAKMARSPVRGSERATMQPANSNAQFRKSPSADIPVSLSAQAKNADINGDISEQSPLPGEKPEDTGKVPEQAETPPRKRKPPPSIFLNQRKKPRMAATKPSPAMAKRADSEAKGSEKEGPGDGSRPVKAIKSSIFN